MLAWRRLRDDGALAVVLAVGGVLLYLVSGAGHPTPYDYFARLGRAFLDGRWWLSEAPSWLNELVPCGEGRYCVVYPPMPAVLTLPFLSVWSGGAAQSIASAVAGGLSAAPSYLSVRAVGAPPRLAVLVTAFSIAGTTLWFSASDGRAWFFAHGVAVLFASLALLAALRSWPPWLVGALLGVGALARLPLALAAAGLVLLASRASGRRIAPVALGIVGGMVPFVLIEVWYDLLRWGTPGESGYLSLTQHGILFGEGGQFSLSSLPRHLYAIVIQPPDFVEGSPFFARPSWIGTSLFLTSPAYLYALRALGELRRRADVGPLAIAGLLPLVPDVLHTAVGFAQFGYRFSLDAQPFLLPLVALGAGYRRGRWSHVRWAFLAALAWSVVANLYGVVAVTHLGYVQ